VKFHTVTLAETTAGITGIISGLNAGDVVVTDGQDKLQDGSKVEMRKVNSALAVGNKSAASSANSSYASPAGGPAR
jgi:multidrug efflux system membrane fusion protein